MATEKRGLDISFLEFWPRYLEAHRKPATRGMHYGATVLGAGATLAAIVFAEPLLCPAGILGAVAMAVGSHRFIEHNQPLIRVNALWGAISDLRMLWLAVTGRLPQEYQRLGLVPIGRRPLHRTT